MRRDALARMAVSRDVVAGLLRNRLGFGGVAGLLVGRSVGHEQGSGPWPR